MRNNHTVECATSAVNPTPAVTPMAWPSTLQAAAGCGWPVGRRAVRGQVFRRFTRLTLVSAMLAAFGLNALAQNTTAGRYDGVVPPGLRAADTPSHVFSGQNTNVDYSANARVGTVVVEVDRDGIPADGQSPVRVTVRLLGVDGKPLRSDAFVTIETSAGRVLLDGAKTDEFGPGKLDADRVVPGIQLAVKQGVASFTLLAPTAPQDVRLRVTSGAAEASGVISFLPELREWIAAGLVEGVITLNRQSRDAIVPARFDDGFEQELRQFQRSFSDGKGSVGARTAFFIKGKIKGEYLLTAAYDSDKDTRDRLTRDVRSDEFYPVYGDSALHGSDVASAGKLFVRIDKQKSYLLYGDLQTSQAAASQLGVNGKQTLKLRDLGDYRRNVLGAKWHFESDGYSGNLFASRDNLTQVIEEFRGLGTSGPYALSNNGALSESERVEMVVRDRNQPSIILRTTPLARLTDYTFEPFSGRILLRQPLPAVDENLNPVSLRIAYEVDQGGDNFWLYGADVQAKLTGNLELGASAVEDKNPLAPYKLRSANLGLRLGDKSVLVAEVARSETTLNSPTARALFTSPGLGNLAGDVAGNAWRIELQHVDDRLDGRLLLGRSDPTFNNTNASLNGGREEALAKARYKVAQEWSVFAQLQKTADRTTGGDRQAGEVGATYKPSERFTVELGLRKVNETAQSVQPGNASFANPSDAGGFFGSGAVGVQPDTGQSLLSRSSTFPTTGGISKASPIDATTLRLGVRYQATDRLGWVAEIERDVSGDDKHRLSLGADYTIAERAKFYARYEDQQALSSTFSANPADKSKVWVAGLQSDYMTGGQLFSEYRLRDALSADAAASRDVVLASGVRNSFDIAAGLRLSASFERLNAIAGNGPDSSAIAGGIEYTANPLWKGAARLEYRRVNDVAATPDNEREDSWLSTVAFARKLDRDWTLLVRNFLLITDKDNSPGQHLQDRVQVGFAYRETDRNRLDVLGKYEFKVDKDEEATLATDEKAHIISLQANYHPSRPWTTTGRVAAKWSRDVFGSYAAYLLGGRVTYDFSEKLDLGVMANMLFSPTGDARQYAYGLEAGYNLQRNLWGSVGYVWKGFRDRDLTGAEYTDGGLFLRLRWKFDENLFGADKPDTNRSLPR